MHLLLESVDDQSQHAGLSHDLMMTLTAITMLQTDAGLTLNVKLALVEFVLGSRNYKYNCPRRTMIDTRTHQLQIGIMG